MHFMRAATIVLAAASTASGFNALLPRTPRHPIGFYTRRAAHPRLSEEEKDVATGYNVISRKGGPRPFTQDDVPLNQQPTQELKELRAQSFFDWSELGDEEYFRRIGVLYAALSILLGLPVALSTYSAPTEVPQALLAAAVGGALPTLGFDLRLRVGWGYVSGRLTDRETVRKLDSNLRPLPCSRLAD